MSSAALRPCGPAVGRSPLQFRHPGQMQLVLDDPAMARAAFEESLRYDYVLKVGNAHYCREELTLCGRTFHKGEMIVPGMIGAFRDPSVFPSPDTFDLRRELSQSVAFGGLPIRLGRPSCDAGVIGIGSRCRGLYLSR
jgi:cytochrome P450